MASVSNDPNGRRRILFVAPDGSRKAIRLGKCAQKSAEAIGRHVEALLAAKIGAQPTPRDTSVWLSEIEPILRDRLAAVDLVEPTKRLNVADYLSEWLEKKRVGGYKPASLIAWGQTVRELTELFGPRPLVALTHVDGESYRTAMRSRELRPTTISKRLIHGRLMLEDAVRFGHISANPWKHVRQRQGDPSERRRYVPVADIERVIGYCPNVWWKLLVALSRHAGLRVPSEALSLTWRDVDWERGRLSVPSPKTEGIGKSYRVIPLFPSLLPHLEAAFEAAEEGAEFVFPHEYRRRAQGPGGWANANLRTTLGKIIRRAGVDPWPRLWHSLRASCESDLAQSFPLAIVAKWLGNTPSVALRHYVDPTEAAFDLALDWRPATGGAKSGARTSQNEAQQVAAGIGTESHEPHVNTDGTAGYAVPCDVLRDYATSTFGGAGNRRPTNAVRHIARCVSVLCRSWIRRKCLKIFKIRHQIRHWTMRIRHRVPASYGRFAVAS